MNGSAADGLGLEGRGSGGSDTSGPLRVDLVGDPGEVSNRRRRELNTAAGRVEALRRLPHPAGPRSVSPAGRQALAAAGAAPKPRPGRRRQLTDSVRQRVLAMRSAGATYAAIAADLGVSEATAHRVVNGRYEAGRKRS